VTEKASGSGPPATTGERSCYGRRRELEWHLGVVLELWGSGGDVRGRELPGGATMAANRGERVGGVGSRVWGKLQSVL
jgi:hypothetical protein